MRLVAGATSDANLHLSHAKFNGALVEGKRQRSDAVCSEWGMAEAENEEQGNIVNSLLVGWGKTFVEYSKLEFRKWGW